MWFYDEADCDRIVTLLLRIAATLPVVPNATGHIQVGTWALS